MLNSCQQFFWQKAFILERIHICSEIQFLLTRNKCALLILKLERRLLVPIFSRSFRQELIPISHGGGGLSNICDCSGTVIARTLTVTFVQVTFVHIRNISAVTDPIFIKTLKVSFWKHLEQIPTVTGTFVQALFVLATFVHVRNISPVSNQILTKL